MCTLCTSKYHQYLNVLLTQRFYVVKDLEQYPQWADPEHCWSQIS